MKKLASLVGAFAMVLVFALPAFASYRHHRSSDDTTVTNRARVSNNLELESETGDNEIHGRVVRDADITTGEAETVGTVYNRVNRTEIGCDCEGDGDLDVRSSARVRNSLELEAETGDNEIHGRYVGGGDIDTGDAYVDGLVDNTVNTTLVGVE